MGSVLYVVVSRDDGGVNAAMMMVMAKGRLRGCRRFKVGLQVVNVVLFAATHRTGNRHTEQIRRANGAHQVLADLAAEVATDGGWRQGYVLVQIQHHQITIRTPRRLPKRRREASTAAGIVWESATTPLLCAA